MAQQANLLQGPEPVETAELHFKLHCRLKVFTTNAKYEEGHCCILAVSQHYGLIFVGNLNGFSVITTKSLHPGINPEEFPKRNIVLSLRPIHISVDNSQKILVVVCNSKSGSVLVFYNIQSFGFKEVTAFKITALSKLIQNSTAEVVDLVWQPNAVGSLVVCMSDGSVLALPQAIKDETMFALPSTTQATCFCWSPKGKQIVIGTVTGTLSQYKPDLKLVKTLPPPPLYNGNVMVVSVLWISSFQFAVAYNDRANPESFPVITIVNAAKNEPVNVINYDDITYSSTLFRNHQIYMSHQTAWNLIFVNSANSIETAVLHMKDSCSWEQWLLGDASRAELPLNPDRQETFPLGWAFDYTSGETIPWGEGSLPPMPRLLLVSDEGLLCVFNVVNTKADAPQLCAPPKEILDDSQFTVAAKSAPAVVASDPATSPQAAKGILGSPPTFGGAKPTFNFQPSPSFGGFTPKPQPKPQEVPVILHQQPEQPQLQITKQQPSPVQVQLQQPPAQPQLPLTITPKSEPSTAPFVPNLSQFSFGGGSKISFAPKPAAAEIPQPSEPRPGSFALQTSATQKDLFSGKNLPQSTPKKQPEVRVQEKTTTPTPAAKKPEEVEPAPKPEEVAAKGESTAPATPELAAVDDSVYLSALEEEVEHFNSELQQLSARMGNFDIRVGTEEDKERMRKSIDGLYGFWNELKETTEGQSAEVRDVVMELMEAFAWLEDAKSRNLQRKNPSYIELKKSEELDPLNARHMSEIAHLRYYIMNQLKQLTAHLEKEWMDHQENHRNEVKNKMTVPPLEEVFKTMHYQLKILHKQKALVEELKGTIALKKRKSKSQQFNILSANPVHTTSDDNRASELSKLAENLLQLKINREEDSAQIGAWELVKSQLAAISDRSKKLTRDKQTALRDALSERDMVKIRPVKTSLESSAFLRSLHLDKTTPKTTKPRPCLNHNDRNRTTPLPTPIVPPPEPQPKSEPLPVKPEEKAPVINNEAPKSAPLEKTPVSLSIQSLSRPEGRSPLASLSGIVSSIGKKTDGAAFVFGSSTFQKTEPSKDEISFGAKSEQKPEETKTSQPFTFSVSKPSESIFGKKEPTAVFGGKVYLPSSISVTVTKSEATKGTPTPNVTITPVTTSAGASLPFSFSAATSSSFTFSVPTTASSTGLPKVNLLFGGKEATSGFGTTATSESIFSVAAPTTTTITTSTITTTTTTTSTSSVSTSSLFSSSVPIFGGANKTAAATTTVFTTSTSLLSFSKPTTDTPAQPSGFAVIQTPETKPAIEPVQASNKAAPPETEEVDVVEVDEPARKPEQDKSKDSPKSATPTPTPTTLSTPEVPSTASSVVSTPSAPLVSTNNVFSKSVPAVVTSSTETSSASAVTVTSVSSSTTTATTTSVFSFASVSSPVFFGQAPTTTTTTPASTTTTNFFSSPALNIGLFGQVSSTTPTTTSIFGGSAPTSTVPPTNIFGGSTPVKAAADHPATPSTTSGNIFASSTPTTNSFGQQTPLSSQGTAFGQQSESIDQTANLFGQLLSDSNKSVFGGSSTPATTANLFTSPKSIFEPTTTTTAATSPFGSSFGTSLFGQPTTTSSVFGQSQTSTANSLFGQSMYSGFVKAAAATPTQTVFKSTSFSEPVFGQNAFAQGFKRTTNTPTFGGSPSSIFGGTPTSTSTNVFQTPTTNATFGSVPPGPFSGGTSTFGESAFGSSPTFQKPLGGFASPPVFGGSPGGSAGAPAFGGSPTFGGSPSFGSLPTFGNVSQGGFGQGSGSTTFENLANQNTVGFGNLAQQTQTQGFGGGFGSSFESKPAFGGNSFSNWRSN